MERESPEIVPEREIDEINELRIGKSNSENQVYNENAKEILEMAGLSMKQDLEYIPEAATREEMENILKRNEEVVRKNDELANAAWEWAKENQEKLDF